MKHSYSFSYGQLYKLFGYQKELNNTDCVFAALVEAVASSPENLTWHYTPSMLCCTDFDSQLSIAHGGYYCRDMKKTKQAIPLYLGKKFSSKEMMRIDARLNTLKQEIARMKRIPWYLFVKKLKAYALVHKLSRPLIALQSVFQFLEYRAFKAGISQKMLHEKMLSYVENHSHTIF